MFKLIIDNQEVGLSALADTFSMHGLLLQNGKPQTRHSAIDTFRPGAILAYRNQEVGEFECSALLLPDYLPLYHSYGRAGMTLMQNTVTAMVTCWRFVEGEEDISTLQRSLSSATGVIEAAAVVPCQAMSDYASVDNPQDRFDEMLFLPRVTEETNQWSLMGRDSAQHWSLIAEFGDNREADFACTVLGKLIEIRDALPANVEQAKDLIGAMLNRSYEICRVPLLEPSTGPAVTGQEIRGWLEIVARSSGFNGLDCFQKQEDAIAKLRQMRFSPREIQRIVRYFPLYQSLNQTPRWS